MKFNGKDVKVEYVHFRVPEIIVEHSTKMKGKPRDIAPYSRARHLWKAFTRGGATLCKLYIFNEAGKKEYISLGKSFCSMSDNFNYKTGRYYALRNALENMKHA